MKQDPEADRDTLPPSAPDMAEAIAVRIEKKLDKLTSIAEACFEKLLEHDRSIENLDDRVSALEAIPSHHPNGNGAAE